MKQAVGNVCLEWRLIEVGGGYRDGEKRLNRWHTLLSVGCTLRIYKEAGVCLPGQQKVWDLYTSAKVKQAMSKYGCCISKVNILIL